MNKRDKAEIAAFEALLEQALKQPGVAEAVEVYERTEAIYTQVSAASSRTAVISTNTTSAGG